MKKIGLILPNLIASQQSFLAINYINNFLKKTSEYDFTIFYENVSDPSIKPMCACMNMCEIWNFDGLLISSNLDNTQNMIQAVNAAKKVFYVWDLEWLRQKKNFEYNLNIYRSNQISLIARSKDHADILDNYCNRRPDSIIPNFNLERIINEFS